MIPLQEFLIIGLHDILGPNARCRLSGWDYCMLRAVAVAPQCHCSMDAERVDRDLCLLQHFRRARVRGAKCTKFCSPSVLCEHALLTVELNTWPQGVQSQRLLVSLHCAAEFHYTCDPLLKLPYHSFHQLDRTTSIDLVQSLWHRLENTSCALSAYFFVVILATIYDVVRRHEEHHAFQLRRLCILLRRMCFFKHLDS